MNHCVPDFEMEDDYSIPTSSGVGRPKKSFMPEDDIMELLWQNGQVIVQSQNQRSVMKSSAPSKYDAVIPADMEIRSSQAQQVHEHHHHHQQQQQQQQQHLFMQEDEMASWLHYPLVDDPSLDHNFSADLLYPAPSVTTATTTAAAAAGTTTNSAPQIRHAHIPEIRTPAIVTAAPVLRPPIPPSRTELNVKNFVHFSRHNKAMVEAAGPSCSKSAAVTVVDSCETPAVGPSSRVCEIGRSPGETSYANLASGGGFSGKEAMRCEGTMTSSPGDSSASAEPPPPPAKLPAEDRKRKGIEADDAECQSEDVEFESGDTKKQVRGTTSTKRSRAAEVHNLSERRRRDRINEKMKALQELIPRCNKSDKASMLDEAIEYLKSLQLQVQMMSMGCGMVPMMFPGIQQYMPPMGMGIGMGMGMGMEMGMNRPIMPFPNVLTGSALPTPAAAAHLGPRFPMPAFHMPPVPTTEQSRAQATSQSDHMFQSFAAQNPNPSRIPNFSDPYQQYLGSHQMQLPVLQQNQAMVHPSTSKPSTSKGPENPENHQSG